MERNKNSKEKYSTWYGWYGAKNMQRSEREHTVAYLISESKNRNSFEFGPV